MDEVLMDDKMNFVSVRPLKFGRQALRTRFTHVHTYPNNLSTPVKPAHDVAMVLRVAIKLKAETSYPS